ncbi:hypothetical protein DRN73_00760 [Candidatus Pacearchaeota archaeon]|nr:MAG: hypothetical protein DRN73_00760 [Candidatus Pacearchaeota archaeon]
MNKLRILFLILILLGIVKFSLILSSFFTHVSLLQAKEKGLTQYTCPPEFSKVLFLEKKTLFEKAKKLEAKEKELKLLEQRIKEQLAVLKDLEVTIDKKLKKIETIQNKRFKLLIKAYSEMRPSKAAQMLMKMDREMALKILSNLKSSQVAKILSSMPPEKAADLSEALSGAPPKEC